MFGEDAVYQEVIEYEKTMCFQCYEEYKAELRILHSMETKRNKTIETDK